MINQFRSSLARLISPHNNTITLPQEFLRYGNKRLHPDWSDVTISDKDLYTGYSYAAIRNRANNVARIASEQIKTRSDIEDYVHPYLDLLKDSKQFSFHKFWSDVSTYLDLEGVYYLMAVRNFTDNRVGNVSYFSMLNPYHIKRIIDKNTNTVIGYTETRKGLIREIPPQMIIEIRELNPFDEDIAYAMTDAAKESQFTLKTAGDFTRHALKGNINAPGIISTDVILRPEEFENFKARIKNHTKGEPLFGNGSGAITYQSMTQDLKNSGLDIVTDSNRDSLFAVSGVSKTIMGIEQSGTTRETAKVQKDLNVEGQILPRIQLILDALNLDFHTNYENEYRRTKALLFVDNPLATDYESDIKSADAKTKQFELYNKMIDLGYSPEDASGYSTGDLTLDQLTPPKKKEPEIRPSKEQPPQIDNSHSCSCGHAHNDLNSKNSQLLDQQKGMLKNAVINIERKMVAEASTNLKTLVKNDITSPGQLISNSVLASLVNELKTVLTAFYGVAFFVEGNSTMQMRTKDGGYIGNFDIDDPSNSWIKEMARKVSASHIDTVLDDIFVTAREGALEGLSLQQVQSLLKSKFTEDISTKRAETIARTETNRAFTRAQYESDRQFIDQNNLKGRTFKKWTVRSDNPCEFCMAMANEPAIPFDVPFRDLGGKIEVNGNQLDINFEALEAGNAHPNCFCIYELIIK